jgi:hypothetical protein
MKQVSVDSPQVQNGWFTAQPRIEKKHWPYRAQARPARLDNLQDIAPAPFDAEKCPVCGGKGRKWIPKNSRTRSLRSVPCECRAAN